MMESFIICTLQQIGILLKWKKSRRMGQAGYVALTGEMRNVYGIIVGRIDIAWET
jgi:hypothetical protein